MLWKAGARTSLKLVARSATMVADPARVTMPFQSILGGGDSQVFAAQARDWHRDIRSAHEAFVLLAA